MSMPTPWDLQQDTLRQAFRERMVKEGMLEDRRSAEQKHIWDINDEERTLNRRYDDDIRRDDAGLGHSLSVRGARGMAAGKAVMDAAEQELGNKFGAATFAANMQTESGFNPGAVGDLDLGPGEEAHGGMQWRKERAALRKQFYGNNPPSTMGDVQFAFHEMKTRYPQVYAALKNAKNAVEANAAMRVYLGYSNKGKYANNELQRLALTQNYLTGKIDGGATDELGGTGGDSGRGTVTTDGDAYEATTSESIPAVAFRQRNASLAAKGFELDGTTPGGTNKSAIYTFKRSVPKTDVPLAQQVALEQQPGAVGPVIPERLPDVSKRLTLKDFYNMPVSEIEKKRLAESAPKKGGKRAAGIDIPDPDEDDEEENKDNG